MILTCSDCGAGLVNHDTLAIEPDEVFCPGCAAKRIADLRAIVAADDARFALPGLARSNTALHAHARAEGECLAARDAAGWKYDN